MVLFIETHRPDAAFNFAFEEYCMEHIANGRKIISIWQANNCVMLGRYQIAQNEINESFRKELNPQIVRRATGGGAIYTDMGTLLFSVIMPVQNRTEIDFPRICLPFVEGLNRLGVKALLQGRNDIVIGERKISGNAQTVRKGYLCAHGSLLYNTDLDVLSKILRTDEGKIKTKAIKSIRSRVTNITEHMASPPPIDLFREQFKDAVLRQETDGWSEHTLTTTDIREITKIKEKKYDSWEWNYGNAPFFNYQNEMYFPSGKLTVRLNIQDGRIQGCKLHGDFLGITGISPLEDMFLACRYDLSSASEKIGEMDLSPYLRGITKEQLLSCMFNG